MMCISVAGGDMCSYDNCYNNQSMIVSRGQPDLLSNLEIMNLRHDILTLDPVYIWSTLVNYRCQSTS